MASKMEEFGFFLTRAFATTKKTKAEWPYIPGKYFVHNVTAPVAVTTLGSVDLAKEISDAKPEGLCIVGKVETENIGIEKIIKNILANPAIQFLICAGAEPPKHLTGATFKALFENGIDADHRIPGSPGMRPQLPNTSADEVSAFVNQVKPILMIDCVDKTLICEKVRELAAHAEERDTQILTNKESFQPHEIAVKDVPSVSATSHDPQSIKLDKEGYFVILPQQDHLLIEHYSYREELLHTITGDNARDLYLTLIEKGWVSKLDHAAYLGKELARAEAALLSGSDFIQDGA